MSLALGSTSPASFVKSGLKRPPLGPDSLLPQMEELDKGEQYMAMLNGYRQHGGLVKGDEVADRLRDRDMSSNSISTVARWVVQREVISFQWHTELWVPLFQFNLHDMSRKEIPRRVTTLLMGVFDAWNLSYWFVQPNAWLRDRAPLELIDRDPDGVLHAAKADRFVAVG